MSTPRMECYYSHLPKNAEGATTVDTSGGSVFQPSCRHPSLQSDTGGPVFLSRLGVRPGGFLFWAMFGIRGGLRFPGRASRGVACSWADGLFGTGRVFLGPTGLLLACCSCCRRGLDIRNLAWCSVAATPVDVCRSRCRTPTARRGTPSPAEAELFH